MRRLGKRRMVGWRESVFPPPVYSAAICRFLEAQYLSQDTCLLFRVFGNATIWHLMDRAQRQVGDPTSFIESLQISRRFSIRDSEKNATNHCHTRRGRPARCAEWIVVMTVAELSGTLSKRRLLKSDARLSKSISSPKRAHRWSKRAPATNLDAQIL